MESLYDRRMLEHMDVFTALFIKECSNTLLPELIEALGPEKLPRFLTVFAGTVFRVPPKDTIDNIIRDAAVYSELREGESLEATASKHGLPQWTVRTIANRVGEVVGDG